MSARRSPFALSLPPRNARELALACASNAGGRRDPDRGFNAALSSSDASLGTQVVTSEPVASPRETTPPSSASARSRTTTFGLLALLLGGCGAPVSVCDAVHDALERCGFPPPALSCEDVIQSEVEALAERFEERDCAAFATDDAAVDRRLCAVAGWPCPTSPLPAPAAALPRFPLVLVAGIDGSPLFDWNPRVLQRLRDSGIATFHVPVLPWGTTAQRARDLSLSLRALQPRTGAAKLNLVCYAVGGLDCRALVSAGGVFRDEPAALQATQARVASVTTIATPHRGTKVADALRSALLDGTATEVLQAFVGDDSTVQVPDDATLLATLDGLTPRALEAFNAEVTVPGGIPHFSWGGVSHVLGEASSATERRVEAQCVSSAGTSLYVRHPDTRDALHPLLWATVPFSFESRNARGADTTSPSDGMVSLESAKWGEWIGCVPADHYDVIGQPGHTTRDPLTGFDAAEFLRVIAGELGRRGL